MLLFAVCGHLWVPGICHKYRFCPSVLGQEFPFCYKSAEYYASFLSCLPPYTSEVIVLQWESDLYVYFYKTLWGPWRRKLLYKCISQGNVVEISLLGTYSIFKSRFDKTLENKGNNPELAFGWAKWSSRSFPSLKFVSWFYLVHWKKGMRNAEAMHI